MSNTKKTIEKRIAFLNIFCLEWVRRPFYLKTQGYSNLESRDLWDYDLDLTPAQIAFLLKHAWEMGSTYSDYYFFTKNCSYQLLTLLEAADDPVT